VGVGLQRGGATWAKRERERDCAKWDEGVSVGAGGAQKGAGVHGWATWPGISVCVRECWCTAGRGEGGADRGSHSAARGNGHAGKRFSALTRWAREAERERSARARETGADRAAPLGRGRGGEGAG
jgi:hypothetical protein